MTSFNIEYAISARDALTPVLRRAQAQLKSMEKTLAGLRKTSKITLDTRQAQSQVDKLKRSIAGLSQNARIGGTPNVGRQNIGGYAGAGSDGVSAGLFSRMGLAGGAVAAGAVVAGYAAKEAIAGAITLETAQLGLRKALDMTSDEMKPYSKELQNLSSNLGIAQEDVTDLATQYAKADGSMNPSQLAEITQLTIASSKAWDVSSSTVQDSFGLMKAIYGQNTAELTNTANAIDMLGDKFGVLNEQYLTEFIRQGGAEAKTMGLTSAGMLAYGAAAGEMKVEAGKAADTLKWLNSALQDTKSAGALRKLGVDFNNLQKMRPEDKIQSVLSALNNYNGADKGKIAKDIIGGNYDDSLKSIAIASDKFKQALELQADSAGMSGRVTKALGMEAETTQGKIDRARQTVRNFGIEIGDYGARGLAYLIDKAREFYAWFKSGTRGVEMFKMALLGIVAIVSPIAAVALVLYNVWQASSALRESFSGLGDVLSTIGDAFSSVTGAFGSARDGGVTLNDVLVTIGASLAYIVDTIASAVDGLGSLGTSIGQIGQGDFSGAKDTIKGWWGRTTDRYSKTTANVMRDYNSPIQSQAAATGGVKAQAGLSGGGTMQQAANTQAQAASTAQAAASVTQSASTLDTAAATINAQSALTQQQAATTQASVGNQFVSAAQQMMAAAQQMMAATSRPLTVSVSASGMGDQGR